MRETDFDAFATMLDDVAGLYPRGAITGGQKAMFFRALLAHSIDAVRAGFDAHVKDAQRGRFQPMPADIIAQIEGLAADDGRPGPEEAWAGALRSADESKTVVWTAEMAEAWSIASPVFNAGDEIGGRMAFKESYARLVDEARRARLPAAWSASLGFDPAQRDEAIAAAATAGRLPAPDRVALPAPEQAFAAIEANAPPAIRGKLLDLRAKLAQRALEPSAAEIDRQRTQDLKQQSAARLAEFDGGAA